MAGRREGGLPQASMSSQVDYAALTDFSKPFNVALLDAAVNVFYQSGNTEEARARPRAGLRLVLKGPAPTLFGSPARHERRVFRTRLTLTRRLYSGLWRSERCERCKTTRTCGSELMPSWRRAPTQTRSSLRCRCALVD